MDKPSDFRGAGSRYSHVTLWRVQAEHLGCSSSHCEKDVSLNAMCPGLRTKGMS